MTKVNGINKPSLCPANNKWAVTARGAEEDKGKIIFYWFKTKAEAKNFYSNIIRLYSLKGIGQ